jgi:hypothetical protein
VGAQSIERVDAGARSVDPERAATVARVRELYSSGPFTHTSLASHLDAAGLASRGERWHASTAVRVTPFSEVASCGPPSEHAEGDTHAF